MSSYTEWDEAAGVLRVKPLPPEVQMSDMGTDTCDFGPDEVRLGGEDEDESAALL